MFIFSFLQAVENTLPEEHNLMTNNIIAPIYRDKGNLLIHPHACVDWSEMYC